LKVTYLIGGYLKTRLKLRFLLSTFNREMLTLFNLFAKIFSEIGVGEYKEFNGVFDKSKDKGGSEL